MEKCIMHSRRDMLKRIGATGTAAVAVTGLSGSAAAAPGSIPSNYLTEYRAAGDAYGIDWTYLAGGGWVETPHGTPTAWTATATATPTSATTRTPSRRRRTTSPRRVRPRIGTTRCMRTTT